MPDIAMKNYPDKQAAFACKLVLLATAHYSAMAVAEIDKFSGPWNKLSAMDRAVVQDTAAMA